MAAHHNNGRSKKSLGGKFVAIPFTVLDSPGYRAASVTARALYVAILSRYNGVNNGYIAVPCRLLANELNISRMTVGRAIVELTNCGLIRQTKASSFSLKRVAAEYRLTHKTCNRTAKPASQEFKFYGHEAVSGSRKGDQIDE